MTDRSQSDSQMRDPLDHGGLALRRPRLDAIDATRGLIMLFMAIDHVGALVIHRHSAEYWGGLWTRYASGDQLQFLLRFCSDFCAPGFFLWMGSGIALLTGQRLREGWSIAAVTRFLVLRGLLLIAIGQLIETPAWIIAALAAAKGPLAAPVPGGGGPIYADISVIFALGASMALIGMLMPVLLRRSLLWIGLGVFLLLICSVLLPTPEHAGDVFPFWQRLLLVAGQTGVVIVEYPVLPWLALACLGVALGQFLQRQRDALIRSTGWVGIVLLGAGLLLRLHGGFGNIRAPRDDSWMEFLNLIKYPPALSFCLIMIGGNLLLFRGFSTMVEHRGNVIGPVWRILATLGRAPLFFYIAHLYLFAIAGAVFFRQGASYPVGLSVWAVGMLPLYFACAWFDRFKRARPSTSVWRML